MSVSLVDLEKQLKAVTKTGKYVVGRKEVLNGLKGSKLVVWSASANVPPPILNECKNLQVPAVRFGGNPIELGKTCGIPYKVSVIAVKSSGDAVLTSFESSRDYSLPRSRFLAQQNLPAPDLQTKPEEIAEKPEAKQTRKKTKAPKKKEKEKTTKSRESDSGEKPAKSVRKKKTPKKSKEKEKVKEEDEARSQAEEDTDEEEED